MYYVNHIPSSKCILDISGSELLKGSCGFFLHSVPPSTPLPKYSPPKCKHFLIQTFPFFSAAVHFAINYSSPSRTLISLFFHYIHFTSSCVIPRVEELPSFGHAGTKQRCSPSFQQTPSNVDQCWVAEHMFKTLGQQHLDFLMIPFLSIAKWT